MKQISLRGPLTWRGSHCAHSMLADSVMRMGSYFLRRNWRWFATDQLSVSEIH